MDDEIFLAYTKELEKIKPIIRLIKDSKLPSSTCSKLIQVKNQLILRYV